MAEYALPENNQALETQPRQVLYCAKFTKTAHYFVAGPADFLRRTVVRLQKTSARASYCIVFRQTF